MQKFIYIFRYVLFFLVLLLFIFIPLYPKFPLINISGTFVAIRIEDLIIALTVSLWGIYLVISNQLKSFLSDKLNLAILLFFFVGFVSTFSAIYLTHTVVAHISILHFLRRVEFVMLLPVVASVVNTRKQLVWILIVLSLMVVTVNLYALGQEYLDWPVISTTNSEFSKGLILRLSPEARVNSTFAGHYDLAAFLAMTISILSALFFAVRKRVKAWIIVVGALSLVILVMTASRLSFVAAFVGVISALVFTKKTKYILFIFGALAIILIYPSQLRERLFSTITVNLLSMGQRYVGKTDDQQIRSKLNIPTLAVKTSS